jgi:hypothetical protein
LNSSSLCSASDNALILSNISKELGNSGITGRNFSPANPAVLSWL